MSPWALFNVLFYQTSPFYLVDDIQVPDALQETEHYLVLKLLHQLLQGEQVPGEVEGGDGSREGGVVQLKVQTY